MKLRALRTYLSRGQTEPVETQVELELLIGVGGQLVLGLTHGHVTGYESFNLMDIDWPFLWEKESLVMCAGTEGRWDKLEIPVTEVYRFVRDRGLIHLGVEVPRAIKDRALEESRTRMRDSMRKGVTFGGEKE